MASISHDGGGFRRILFKLNGKRIGIRLGHISLRSAETIRAHVEEIIEARGVGRGMEPDTVKWLREIDAELHAKLVVKSLATARSDAGQSTLGAWLDAYIGGRTDVKPNTATVYGHTRRCLIDYFGASKPLADVTDGDADNWRIWLGEHEKLADNTVSRRCGIAKQFFRAAVRRRLIVESPFADMRGCVGRANKARDYFLNRDDAQKVIDACPDAQWRLLFALSRYGGLRCPSEHLALRWADVDWQRGRITIHASKTEHHADSGIRVIPIFGELRPYLEDVWELAEPETEFVITRYRDCNANLRTQLERIIGRAGLKPWPKLFHNLRSTRETELAASHPMHVVCAWIGNTQKVALKHYLQVTDADFELATKAAHKAAQTTANPSELKRTGKPATEKSALQYASVTNCPPVQWAALDSNQ